MNSGRNIVCYVIVYCLYHFKKTQMGEGVTSNEAQVFIVEYNHFPLTVRLSDGLTGVASGLLCVVVMSQVGLHLCMWGSFRDVSFILNVDSNHACQVSGLTTHTHTHTHIHLLRKRI